MPLRYLLDTNTLSEPMLPRPDHAVIARLDATAGTHATSTLTWHELRFGVARLPASRRRAALEQAIAALGTALPILAFDREAADWLASEGARLERSGRTAPMTDAMIAAIAVTRGLTLVTRNVRDFRSFRGLAVESWHAEQR